MIIKRSHCTSVPSLHYLVKHWCWENRNSSCSVSDSACQHVQIGLLLVWHLSLPE